MKKITLSAARAFLEGRKLSGSNTQVFFSEGMWIMSLFGNVIAKRDENQILITSAGWFSVTTKERLNGILRLSTGQSISQKKGVWYINDESYIDTPQPWDGNWKSITWKSSVTAPETQGDVFVTGGTWVSTDGWRGYERPEYAIAGSSDTGMWSDSPAPSDKVTGELEGIKEYLSKNGIRTKEIATKSSNVFMVKRWLIPMVKDVERARELVAKYEEENDLRYAYAVAWIPFTKTTTAS